MSRWWLALIAAVSTAAAPIGGCGGSEVSRALGARCDVNDECDERCLAPASYPGGFCTLSCDDDADCPGDGRCVAEEGGICLFECSIEVTDDCGFLGTGWSCAARSGKPDGEVEVCVGP